MIKILVVKSLNYPIVGVPSEWKDSDWKDIQKGSVAYKAILTFSHYVTQDIINQVDAVFESHDEFGVWLATPDVPPTMDIWVDIANHPNDNTITRKARSVGFPLSEEGFKFNFIALRVDVHSYDSNGVEQKQLFGSVDLIADNSVRIPIPGGGDIGEYDYLIGRINSSEAISQVITDVLTLRGNDGTIDEKLGLI